MSHDISCSLGVGLGRGTSYTRVRVFPHHKNFITLWLLLSVTSLLCYSQLVPVLTHTKPSTTARWSRKHKSEEDTHTRKGSMLHPQQPSVGSDQAANESKTLQYHCVWHIPKQSQANSHKHSYGWCLKFQTQQTKCRISLLNFIDAYVADACPTCGQISQGDSLIHMEENKCF